MPHQPPRLILGCALLFWGAMIERPLLALVMALAVEGSHWTRVRWDFDDTACGRAWRLSVAAMVVAMALIWLDGNRYSAMPVLLSWLPLLLMPMQLVQSYGLRDAMPVSELSFLAKQRRERNLRLGLESDGAVFNFGNVLFPTALIAASVGGGSSSWLFLPGTLVLTGWMLMSVGKCRPLLMVPVLLVAGLMAFGGRIALERAEEWLGRQVGEGIPRGFDPNFATTLIGRTGTVQQSKSILWRLWSAPDTAPPRLLRSASFNTYLGTNWQNQRVASIDFRGLDSRMIDGVPHYTLGSPPYDGTTGPLPGFRLRGTVEAESPLPLPGNVAALAHFEFDGVESNSFGTVRIYPSKPVIEGTVLWGAPGNPEGPPLPEEDLRIPLAEREVIGATVADLGITSQMAMHDKLNRVRGYFHKGFTYTRDLRISQPPYRIAGPTAITRFLTTNRSGHCEYFATAAALLLREAGVPTRYATGFAVIERDTSRGFHVIRGTHGHAWCRVWDENANAWFDFDPTPPDWIGSLATQVTYGQRIMDTLKRLREDFFLWRNRAENRMAVLLVMAVVGLLTAGLVARRLWTSYRRLDHQSDAVGNKGTVRTPLHMLEKAATRLLGARPPGLTYAKWLSGLRHGLPDAGLLDQAITLHQRLRYDPEPADAEVEKQLAGLTRQILHALGPRGAFSRKSPS